MGHKVYAPNGAKNVTAKLDMRVILDFLLHFINFLWRLLHGINTRVPVCTFPVGSRPWSLTAQRRGAHVLVSEAGVFHIMEF
jgi:hypothetical protein